MKSILYVGAALMIGASIYGFVDYKKTSHKKEFKTMYVEPATTDPSNGTTASTTVTANKTDEEPKVAATNEVTNTSSTNTTKKTATKKTVKKKREFSTKLFSRGALDERYLDPVKPEENKKTENKEQ